MNRNFALGLLLALMSAAAFGSSGAFAKGLLLAGWTPAGAVTWRVAIGAVLLAVPGAMALQGRWHLLRRGWPTVLLFGIVAVAGVQLFFFFAVERLSVGVALLIEYLAVLLVVVWLWLRHGQRPRPLTIIAAALAIAGLLFVLDLFGAFSVDLIGVAFGLVAAIGLAGYFVMSSDDSHGIPALALAAGGLIVGSVALLSAGLIGLVPMRWNTADVLLAGAYVPWWLAVAALGFVAAAFSYLAGVMANRRLGSKLASFLGLSEVLFAVLWAWLLLGELPAAVQLFGGALILAAVVMVKLDERPAAVVALGATGVSTGSEQVQGSAAATPATPATEESRP